MAPPDFSTIFSVLAGADKAAKESDPYLPFGDFADQFGQLLVKQSPQYSLGENAIAGLVTGLLGGGADYLSQDYQAGQSKLAQGELENLITGRLFERPEGMSSSVFDSLDNVQTAFKINNQAQDDIARREGQRYVFSALASARTPREREQVINAARSMGYIDDEFSMPASEAQPIARPNRASSAVEMGGPDLGLTPLKDLERLAFQENLDLDMPPTQAATSARAMTEDVRKRNKELFGSSLQAENDMISQMEDLIRTGESGMARAGDTGSSLASAYEKALSYFGFPEASEQAAGDKELELTRNLGASINRIKGSGALSDFESKALFATALSPTNTRAQNEAILERYKIGLEAAKEHQSFMNYYMSEYGGSPEKAQALWDLYKEQNPVAVKDDSGKMVINQTRTPWQKFDFSSAYKGFLSGEKPKAKASETSQKIDVPALDFSSAPRGMSFEDFKKWKRSRK